MSNQATVLFESLATGPYDPNPPVLPIVSAKAKGCGYSGQTNGMHTVQFSTTGSFRGIVKIQGTLATTPVDIDWYDIDLLQLGDNITPVSDATITANFSGNHVWIRGIITAFSAGNINRVLLTHN